MLTLHLLGHTYVSRDQVPLRLSAKALALIGYLVLEQQAQHRELLADLLWPGASGIGNLRVELSKMRRLGLDIGPTRSPMLSLSADTDLQHFMNQASCIGAAPPGGSAFDDWLSLLRGTPLSGLEDVGTERFQLWLDGQRQRLNDRIEQVLRTVNLQREARADQRGAQQILRRAEALDLGWTSDRTPPENDILIPDSHPRRFVFASTAVLQTLEGPAPADALPTTPVLGPLLLQASDTLQELATSANSMHPQLVLLSGRSGSGRSSLIGSTFSQAEGLTLDLDGYGPPSMWLVALLLQLLPLLSSELRPRLRTILDAPGELQTDLIRLAPILFDVRQPLRLVIQRADHLSASMIPMLGFLMNLPLQLMMILTSHTATASGVLRMLGTQLAYERLHHLQMPPVTPASVRAELGPNEPQHLLVIQQSEGWRPAVRELLEGPPDGWRSGRRATLSGRLQQLLLAEVSSVLPGELDGVARLAALPMPFTPSDAMLACGEEMVGVLRAATAASLLERVPPELDLNMQTLSWRIPDGEYPLAFVSELQRSALSSSLPPTERKRLRELEPLAWNERADETATSALLSATPLSAPLRLPAPTGKTSHAHGSHAHWIRVPGGYQVAYDEQLLQITRLGWGRSPTLHLSWPEVPVGEWQMILKLGLFSGRPEDFPLGVKVAGQWHLLDGMQVTPGEWYGVSGPATTGTFRVSLRARDLALSIAEIRVAGQVVPLAHVARTHSTAPNLWVSPCMAPRPGRSART